MDKMLPLLAIETTGELCSVALIIDKNSIIEMNYMQKHIHSKLLITMVDVVMKSAGIQVKDLKAIAVSEGPGSFTGTRIGFSAAKGLAFGSGLPLIPVPSFDAFAYQISKHLQPDVKFIIANTASVEKIYVSKYLGQGNSYTVLEDVKLISKNDFYDFCNDINLIYGNFGERQIYLSALYVGLWAYLFGKDLLTFDYDYLEPEYFGNPFIGDAGSSKP